MPPAAQPSKSKKSARSAAKSPVTPPASPPAPSVWRRWLFRPATLIIAAALAAVLVLAPYVPWLLPNLSEQPDYQLSFEQIDVNLPDRWVPGSVVEEVRRTGNFPETFSLLRPDLCRDLALAWQQHPWVRKVNSVQITPTNRVQVDAEFRMPVAFVRTERGLYPVDRQGILLPPTDFSMAETDKLPLIRGVLSQPASVAGTPWGDEAVTGAAQLAEILAPQQNLKAYWTPLGLKAIVIPSGPKSQSLDDLTYELETQGGSRIVWGKAPGSDALEPTIDQKLLRLQQYVNRFGSFEGPNGPYRVDIRQFDAIGLEPLNGILR